MSSVNLRANLRKDLGLAKYLRQSLKKNECNQSVNTDESRVDENTGVRMENENGQKMNMNDKSTENNDLVVNMDNHGISSNVKSELDNSLLFVPTEIIGDDREVVVFDEEMVELGIKNWVNTLCGYFVGCNMTISELRYNVRRMWSRCGLRDVLPHSNVQRWQHDVCLEKKEPSKLPLWVKLLNVPLEAWTHKGISALASGVGKPIIMDALTTEIFHSGKGRMGFARVLVEVDTSKGFKKLLRQDTQNRKEHDVVNNGAEKKKHGDENEGFVEVQYKKKTQDNGECGIAENKNDDAHEHVERVLDIVNLFNIPGVSHDAVMMRVFPITLTGAAKRWVDKHPPETVDSWDLLKKAFRYCPLSRIAKQFEEIRNFKQEGDETLYQDWE
ncbi:zinc knuckle CX2CX4HX4C containing protein [Tanacetum coccineum]